MLKRFIAILLIVFTVGANFSKLYVYAGYEINRNYIANTLCQNINKPWLHCNGRCYLMKKIKQAEEKERSDERQAGKGRFQEGIVSNLNKSGVYRPLIVLQYSFFQVNVPSHTSSAIFRPPQV
jgi:hypothetical protein